MTPPTDLQAKAPKELREEIERLLVQYGLHSQFKDNFSNCLRELAAFCYRDAERIVHALAELPAPAGNDRRFKTANECAEAIARRAKEMT